MDIRDTAHPPSSKLRMWMDNGSLSMVRREMFHILDRDRASLPMSSRRVDTTLATAMTMTTRCPIFRINFADTVRTRVVCNVRATERTETGKEGKEKKEREQKEK